jgi:hypothetical protein
MPRLINRQLQIPNGMHFYLPAAKWHSPPGASFNVICDGLERVVQAHPALAAKHGWPRDRLGIENWVDAYNAHVCARMGWDNYIMDESGAGSSTPKASPPHQQETLRSLKNAAARARELVAGAKQLGEWMGSKSGPVDKDLALRRAQVCSACPLNLEGDWTKWFTVPAAELIRRQVEQATGLGLTTPADDRLHLCEACHCPLKLKVHVPIDYIAPALTPEVRARLKAGKDCWILSESP